MQIDAATAILIAAAIGALSSGATAIIILLINKRSEERRQMRDLAMKAAVDNWRYVCEAAEKAGVERYPLEVFIVHMLKLSEVLLSSSNLNADNLTAKLQEVERVTDIAMAEARRHTEKTTDLESPAQSRKAG
jgi:hypothetical protein